MTLRFSRWAVFAALVVAVLVVGCKKTKPAPADDAPTPAAGTPGPAGGAAAGGAQPAGGPPAGWSEARDTIGGFRLFVPGSSRVLDMTGAPEDKKRLQMTMISAGTVLDAKIPMVTTHSLVPVGGLKIGSSPDELYAGLLQLHQGVMTFKDVLSKESITLGGRPGLRVLTKANNYSPPRKVPDNPKFEQQMADDYKKDIARRTTYLVTTTATRVIVILVQSEGDPNPADLKTMIDSFAFL